MTMRMRMKMRMMRTKTKTKRRTTSTTTATATTMSYSIICSMGVIRFFVRTKDRESQIEGLEPKGDSPQKLDAGIIEFKERLLWVDCNFTQNFLGISWLPSGNLT